VSTASTAHASRLTETLESTLKSPARSSEFDLLANTNGVLSDVGLTAADCGGRLSFYGQLVAFGAEATGSRSAVTTTKTRILRPWSCLSWGAGPFANLSRHMGPL
jgi:hypothetical protein